MKRKAVWTLMTLSVMLVLSLLLIKLVDSMVQIDDDMGLLLVFLAAVNAAAALISHRLYKKKSEHIDKRQ